MWSSGHERESGWHRRSNLTSDSPLPYCRPLLRTFRLIPWGRPVPRRSKVVQGRHGAGCAATACAPDLPVGAFRQPRAGLPAGRTSVRRTPRSRRSLSVSNRGGGGAGPPSPWGRLQPIDQHSTSRGGSRVIRLSGSVEFPGAVGMSPRGRRVATPPLGGSRVPMARRKSMSLQCFEHGQDVVDPGVSHDVHGCRSTGTAGRVGVGAHRSTRHPLSPWAEPRSSLQEPRSGA